MKGFPLQPLIAACWGSVILLSLFSTSLSLVGVLFPPAFFPFGRTAYPESAQSNRGSRVVLNQAVIRSIELPVTANRNFEPLTDDVAAPSHLGMAQKLIDLHNFVAQVRNNQKNEIRGVYVPGLFALQVIQQPKNNPVFVSNKHDRLTQFQNATRHNVTGLLAHNYLAGRFFQKLSRGDKVLVVYGDSNIRRYQVVSIHHFQKLEPANIRSSLIDLHTGETLTTAQIFRRFYGGEHHVTFQTCLEYKGRLDWGLTFVVASPPEY